MLKGIRQDICAYVGKDTSSPFLFQAMRQSSEAWKQ